jgi:hypothetical protein
MTNAVPLLMTNANVLPPVTDNSNVAQPFQP